MSNPNVNSPFPQTNLHIIGAQKSGTSALAHFLSLHPDICVVDGKEAHVFDQPDFYSTTNTSKYAQQRYATKLSHYNSEKYICDATPITLFNRRYMQACYEYNPNARFIVLLRDPVSRAESHYRMMRSRGKEKHGMLLAFLLEHFRLKGEAEDAVWKRESAWRDFSYLHRGVYARQLEYLFSIARTEQVLILRQEELLANHQNTLDRVFDFLDVSSIELKQEKVFAGAESYNSCLDPVARTFARLYFWVKKLGYK